MKSWPRVVVVGAGVGGVTLAAVLTKIGVPCVVFERAGSLAEAGTGVQLSPNAIRPLFRLGIGPALRRHAVPIAAMEVRSWRDIPISRTTLGDGCRNPSAAELAWTCPAAPPSPPIDSQPENGDSVR